MQVMHVKYGHPSCAVTPFPTSEGLMKEEHKSIKLAGTTRVCQTIWMLSRCAVLGYCMKLCSHAQMQAKSCRTYQVPWKMSRALLRSTDADWCSGRSMQRVALKLLAGQLLHRLECLTMAIVLCSIVSRKVT